MIQRSMVVRIAGMMMLAVVCLQNTSSAQEAVSSDRLFIDLPGSYGGRLYYDEPAAAAMMANRVLVDTVRTGEQTFTREYWAVYAGMGMWEGVINCYAKEGAQYRIVSMAQQINAGKPGEETVGGPMTVEQLKAKVVDSLRDTTNTAVARFTTMLNTVQINK